MYLQNKNVWLINVNQNCFSKLKHTRNILADLYPSHLYPSHYAMISRTENEYWELLSVENNSNCRCLLFTTNV